MIKFAHNNFNVLNLESSLKFYKEALGLQEVRRVEKPDFTLVYLGDRGETPHQLVIKISTYSSGGIKSGEILPCVELWLSDE